MGFPHKDGIVVKTSYTVDRSKSADADEISLVEKKSPISLEMDDMYTRNASKGSDDDEMTLGGRSRPKVGQMRDMHHANFR